MHKNLFLIFIVFFLIFINLQLDAGKKRKAKLERILNKYDYYSSDINDDYWKKAILGNGLLGTVIRGGGAEELKWKLGRSDVYSTGKGIKKRVPMGEFVVSMKSMIQENNIHLSLYKGEAEGELITASGSMRWKSFIPAKKMVCYIEYTVEGTENPEFSVNRKLPIPPSFLKDAIKKLNKELPLQISKDKYCLDLNLPGDLRIFEEIKNAGINKEVFDIPDDVTRSIGNIKCFIQKFPGGGGFVVAWGKKEIGDRKFLLAYTIDYFKSGSINEYKAAGIVQQALNTDIEVERKKHHNKWKNFYRASYINFPMEDMNKFFWCSMYKLGAGLRGDGKGKILDNYGPWFNSEITPEIQCSGQLQSFYRGLNTLNHSDLIRPYISLFAGSLGSFKNSVPVEYKDKGAAALGAVTDIWGKSYSKKEFANYIYALHNVYIWCRYKQNENILINKFYPALKAAVRYMLNRLEQDVDGIYHIQADVSPGYSRNFYTDTSYDISLLQWGLGILISLNNNFALNDSDAEEWVKVKANLKSTPENEDGLMVASHIPFEKINENPAHLLAFYPLKILNADSNADFKLCEKSFKQWVLFKGLWNNKQPLSMFQASCMASELHDGNSASNFFKSGRRKCRNLKGNPGIYFASLESLSKMLLQSSTSSYNDYRILIFPAIPDYWQNVEFKNLRAEGGFQVSAAYKDGELNYVKIKSLYGSPCNVEMNFVSDFEIDGTRLYSIKHRKDELNRTYYTIDLKQNEYVLFKKTDE